MKKTIAIVLIAIIFMSPAAAIPAQAQWIDISTMAKEYGLDALGWMLVDRIIKRITASTVNWINSGFKGSPAYVTNPESYFKDIADKTAGQYIFSNPNLKFLCGPIQAKIRIALARNYTGDYDRWSCTLTEVGRNMEDFMSDFNNGGWDNFFELTQRQQNSPIGAYLQAENEMFQEIESKTNEKLKELDWGQGIMSFKTCELNGPPIEVPPGSGKMMPGGCLKESTATPGSAIQSQLNEALGSGGKRLQVADEINEIVSALLNQLLSQALGGVGGLLGSSKGSASTGGTSLVEQLRTSNDLTGYFKETQDTSVLDTPSPGSSGSSGTPTTPPPSPYTTAELMASANSLTYDTAVTAAQMNAIEPSWTSKIAEGSVQNINANSVLAYMLGWGGAVEGTTETVSGITYILNTGTWIKTSYTLDQLMTSANTLPYNVSVTNTQMDNIRDSWVQKILSGTVPNIVPSSVLAYMLGWGGAAEGTVNTVSGSGTTITYKLDTGTWIKQ